MRKLNRSKAWTIFGLLVLAALYFLPRMVQGFLEAHRMGAEIRQQQGR